ncbi:MAG: response regulator [Pseudomonadota bacterium]
MRDSFDFSQCRVLIVEDSDLMRSLLRDVLHTFDFKTVTSVSSAEAALTLLESHRYDVILTDWLLTGSTGLDLVKSIRQHGEEPARRTPILMCTAYTDRARLFAARDAGVNEILAKPITPTRLYDSLGQAIYRHRDFIDEAAYIGPDRRRRQIPIDFADRRGSFDLD